MAEAAKKARKKWYPIHASKDFNNAKLGESYVTDKQELLGKHISLNLMTLSNDPKKQSVTLTFVVTSLQGDMGIADIVTYTTSRSHVRRMMRKNTRKIEDAFIITTKDGKTCAAKFFIITRFKATNSIATTIRHTLQHFLKELSKTQSSVELFQNLINNKIQIELKNTLKKIYPVAIADIRVLSLTH